MPSVLKILPVDSGLFFTALDGCDECAQTAYLDRYTGELLFVYEDDEQGQMTYAKSPLENREDKIRVEENPGRYLEIPADVQGDDDLSDAERFLAENGIQPAWV